MRLPMVFAGVVGLADVVVAFGGAAFVGFSSSESLSESDESEDEEEDEDDDEQASPHAPWVVKNFWNAFDALSEYAPST